MSGDLIDTTEMYLKTVFELQEEGVVPIRARIAERLGHSGPTVSQTVARMERDGLLVVSGDRHLELTPEGQDRATRVMRKHRLAERLLTDVIGLGWEYVHDEACRWEHVMSERVEKHLVQILEHPHVSPYGNPIPGLEGLGETAAEDEFLEGVVSIVDAVSDEESTVLVRRLGEPLQVDVELLARLGETGVVPGSQIRARRDGDLVVVRRDGATDGLALLDDVARHLYVADRRRD